MNEKLCSVNGCQNPLTSRGWCNKHYSRWRRHGDPLKTVNFSDPELALQVHVLKEGECHLWQGTTLSDGYGRIIVNQSKVPVHRYVYEKEKGAIPENLYIDHICHRRNCVNPDHLRLATSQQNSSNLSGPASNTVSGVRNVRRHRNKWQVQVQKNYKEHYFGTYSTIEEAAEVAEKARKTLFGEYAGKG